MGRNKVLGRVQRPERKEHVRVGSQAGVMVVTEEMEARGDREAGRKEEDWGDGGGAKAFCPKGLLVPGAGCYFGTVPALQRCGKRAILASSPSGNTTSQPSWASHQPRASLLEPRPAATTQTPFFAGSGSVIRVWSPGGLHPLPGAARLAGGGGGGAWWRGPTGLPSSGTHVSWALDSDRSLLASRPLAKALLLFLRKMQQESSLLLQSSKGSLGAGLRFPGQRQVRPSKHALGPVVQMPK